MHSTWKILYCSQIYRQRKHKPWIDGKMKSSKGKLEVFSSDDKVVDSMFYKQQIEPDLELEFDRHLVLVECLFIPNEQSNVTPIIQHQIQKTSKKFIQHTMMKPAESIQKTTSSNYSVSLIRKFIPPKINKPIQLELEASIELEHEANIELNIESDQKKLENDSIIAISDPVELIALKPIKPLVSVDWAMFKNDNSSDEEEDMMNESNETDIGSESLFTESFVPEQPAKKAKIDPQLKIIKPSFEFKKPDPVKVSRFIPVMPHSNIIVDNQKQASKLPLLANSFQPKQQQVSQKSNNQTKKKKEDFVPNAAIQAMYPPSKNQVLKFPSNQGKLKII